MRGNLIALVAGATAALALAGAAVVVAGGGEEKQATRDALAQSTEVVRAPDRTLGLSRVVIPAGVNLALHHHEGTQIAQVRKGTLTYKVSTGVVNVMKGEADESPELVRTISAGQKGKIKAGEWIVEQPSDHHSAINKGKHKVVILLANLLRTGAQPSTPG